MVIQQTNFARQLGIKSVSEVLIAEMDYTLTLDSDETISSISSVAEVTTSDLTIGTASVNTSIVEIDRNNSVAIGKAIAFTVSGGTAGTIYTIRAIVVTSGGQTKVENMLLHVVSD